MGLTFKKLHPSFVAEASRVDLRDVHDDAERAWQSYQF